MRTIPIQDVEYLLVPKSPSILVVGVDREIAARGGLPRSAYLKIAELLRQVPGWPRRAEMKVLEEMKAVAATLQQLVSFLTVERRSKDDAIKSILLVNHPAFRAFASATGTAYRVFFTDKEELEVWLRYRSWSPIPEQRWDEGSVMEWESSRNKQYLMLTHNIFLNDGRLKPMTEAEWKSSWLKVQEFTVEEEPEASDLPF